MSDRITLSSTSIKFLVEYQALALQLIGEASAADAPTGDACIAVERAFNLKRRGVEARLVISAILTGRQPVDLTARILARQIDLLPSWRGQPSPSLDGLFAFAAL